jgi:hypothetical protein
MEPDMSPQKQSQKVPTDKELDDFERRKNPQTQPLPGSLAAPSTQSYLPPQSYQQAPPHRASQAGGPRRNLILVAALVGALIVLVVGALFLFVMFRVW